MNRKGGAIVEAALVFPVMILTIIAVLWMLVFFYQHIEKKTDMHIALRSESGAICGNMNYIDYASDLQVYQSAQGIYCYDMVQFESKGILSGKEKEIQARKYLINEVDLIWITDLMRKKVSSNYE